MQKNNQIPSFPKLSFSATATRLIAGATFQGFHSMSPRAISLPDAFMYSGRNRSRALQHFILPKGLEPPPGIGMRGNVDEGLGGQYNAREWDLGGRGRVTANPW